MTHRCNKNITTIVQGEILTGCSVCLRVQGNEFAAKHQREWQKKEYRRDTLQTWQPEYARVYPDQFRELHGDEAYRKYS